MTAEKVTHFCRFQHTEIPKNEVIKDPEKKKKEQENNRNEIYKEKQLATLESPPTWCVFFLPAGALPDFLLRGIAAGLGRLDTGFLCEICEKGTSLNE